MQRDDALEKAQAADDLHEKTEASALPSESSSEQAIDEAFLVVWDKGMRASAACRCRSDASQMIRSVLPRGRELPLLADNAVPFTTER